jgi:hypothetical protein
MCLVIIILYGMRWYAEKRVERGGTGSRERESNDDEGDSERGDDV